MTLTLHINDESGGPRERAGRVEDAVRVALATESRAGGRLARAEISVTLLSPEAIQAINRDYRAVDAPTDVLSFALEPDPGADEDAGVSLLGDIYLCPRVAAETADELGIDVEEEILRLAIHGALHLLGHDHPDGEDRYGSEMFEIQERVLSSLRD